jgi:hypothetical protein
MSAEGIAVVESFRAAVNAGDEEGAPQRPRYTGRKVVFAPWSISWHDGLPFPRAAVVALWRRGYVPQIRVFTFPLQDYAPAPHRRANTRDRSRLQLGPDDRAVILVDVRELGEWEFVPRQAAERILSEDEAAPE